MAQRGLRGALRRLVQQRSASDPMSATGIGALPLPAIQPLRRRMLIVESVAPDPARDSGSMRLCQMMRLIRAEGWHIDFIAADGFTTPADAARLSALGVRCQRGHPLRWLQQEGGQLDAVLLCRLPVADQFLGVVRKFAPHARVIFDTVDLHYVREQRAAVLTGNKLLSRYAARSKLRELGVIAHSDITLVVSEAERLTLAREAPRARAILLSNIHEIHGRHQDFDARRDLLFVGGFGHPPNEDAVQWFASEVLPRLRAVEPDLVLHVAGDVDETSRRSLVHDGLRIHGRVADLAPLMESCRISVAPLRFGAGVKGKVNLAMSYGLPVVVTSVAAEGMFLVNESNALVADGAEDFARAVLRLYRDQALWTRLSDGALDNIRNHFSVEQARLTLRDIFPETDAQDLAPT